VLARTVRSVALHTADLLAGVVLAAGSLAIWSWWSIWHWIDTVEGAAVVDLLFPAALLCGASVWLTRRRLPWIAAGVGAGGATVLLVVGGLLAFSLQMATFH
jgi:hypothetical protein